MAVTQIPTLWVRVRVLVGPPRTVRLMDRTSDYESGSRGSNPLRSTKFSMDVSSKYQRSGRRNRSGCSRDLPLDGRTHGYHNCHGCRVEPCRVHFLFCRGVAQSGRVPGSGPGCRRFESSYPDHLFRGGIAKLVRLGPLEPASQVQVLVPLPKLLPVFVQWLGRQPSKLGTSVRIRYAGPQIQWPGGRKR